MIDYKEIVTKAVISKGKRLFKEERRVTVESPTNILGCWIINHKFNGTRENNDIIIKGSYDVNIWYSSFNNTKTDVVCEHVEYQEIVHMRDGVKNDTEVIVRSLKQPSCVRAYLEDNNICYTIEKELGIELVGDIKVKVEAKDMDDVWDEISEDTLSNNNDINNVNENFINEEII